MKRRVVVEEYWNSKENTCPIIKNKTRKKRE